METVTMFYARDIYTYCPKCNAQLDGWVGDPRGTETECEICNTLIKIGPDIDIEFE